MIQTQNAPEPFCPNAMSMFCYFIVPRDIKQEQKIFCDGQNMPNNNIKIPQWEMFQITKAALFLLHSISMCASFSEASFWHLPPFAGMLKLKCVCNLNFESSQQIILLRIQTISHIRGNHARDEHSWSHIELFISDRYQSAYTQLYCRPTQKDYFEQWVNICWTFFCCSFNSVFPWASLCTLDT